MQYLKYFVISGPYTFSIGDTSGLSDYISGGYAVQCKMPKTLDFVRIKQFCSVLKYYCEDQHKNFSVFVYTLTFNSFD